jgi:hypothetical protein
MILLLNIACLKDFNGTVVGNPGSSSSAQIAASENSTYSTAGVTIDSISYLNEKACPSDFSPSGDYCPTDELDTIIEDLDTTIDLLDGTDKFELLSGSWTSITFTFAPSSLYLEGIKEDTEFQIELDLAPLIFLAEDPYQLETDYVLELASPDWLLNQDIEDVDSLEQIIVSTSSFFLDVNQDGIIQDDERINEPLTLSQD